jgi:hypothetical protein
MKLQIWHDDSAVQVHGLEASSLGFWLTADTTKPLPESFSLQITARVFGAQVGTVTIDPMKNGKFSMPLGASAGTVEGKIDDWTAHDKDGHAVEDPHWRTATTVSFTVTGVADVTITATTIAAVVPGLGLLAKAALAILGNKLKISIAHRHVVAHLPHGTGGA